MLESFFIALEAVVPFLCYLLLGAAARHRGLVDEPFLNQLTKLVFNIAFPCMTFINISTAGRDIIPSTKLMMLTAGGILVLEGMLLVVVPRLVREDTRRGVIIQALYRSNFVLFGLPLTENLYGAQQTAKAAILVTVVVTIFNVTSVLILALFDRSEAKVSAAGVLRNLVHNHILQGCCLGLVFFALNIRLPKAVESAVSSFANITTPLAMFALGGTIRFPALRKNLKYLVPSLIYKLLVFPMLILILTYWIGLRDVELFLALIVFATPVASSSYPMAMSMGGDGELAGQFVVTSTVISVFTLFGWIFALNALGLL